MMKNATLLSHLCLLSAAAMASAGCLDQQLDDGQEVVEFAKNGKLGERTVVLAPGKLVQLQMNCAETYSCDMDFWATPCTDWVASADIAPGTHLATFSNVVQGSRTIEHISSSFNGDTYQYTSNWVELPITSEVMYETSTPWHSSTPRIEPQLLSIRSIGPNDTIAATLSLAPGAPESVCLKVNGKYW